MPGTRVGPLKKAGSPGKKFGVPFYGSVRVRVDLPSQFAPG
jgi:hypothetical protein